MRSPMTPAVEATDLEKRRAVDRIVASGALGRTSKLPALLTYLVEQELAGKGEGLKGYSIATDVLGRAADFDPATDSIVRVEMRRLRQALTLYYATGGADDPVKITIPPGTYRPSFDMREALQPSVSDAVDAAVRDVTPPMPQKPDMPDGTTGSLVRGAGTLISLLLAAALGLLLWFSITPLFQQAGATRSHCTRG